VADFLEGRRRPDRFCLAAAPILLASANPPSAAACFQRRIAAANAGGYTSCHKLKKYELSSWECGRFL
jgi:hypothetical protein